LEIYVKGKLEKAKLSSTTFDQQIDGLTTKFSLIFPNWSAFKTHFSY
jgi:hypothetical protein